MDFQNKEHITIFLVFVGFVLTKIPYIGVYFKIANTLIHESGHAMMAFITNAQVLSVELFSDTSGTAVTKSKNKFGQFMISLAGYPFASAVAYIFFYLIKNDQSLLVLYFLAGFTTLNLIFFVRNKYGIFWLVTFLILLGLDFYFANDFVVFMSMTFIAGIILTESVYSTFELFVISLKDPKKSGDARNLATVAWLPSAFWALVFIAQSCFFAYEVVLLYLPVK
jgi:hypothetical protein